MIYLEYLLGEFKDKGDLRNCSNKEYLKNND